MMKAFINNSNFKRIFCCLITAFLFNIFAQSTDDGSDSSFFNYTVDELLCSYLENDLELQKLTLEVEKSRLALDSTKLEQGFDVTLSTGTMTFYTSSSGTVINVKPSVKAELKKINNLAASVSTDFQVKTNTSTNSLKDTKFLLSMDIFSQAEVLQKVALLKSERTLLESQRKLQSVALSTEKKFYNELENLLNQINSIYTYRQDLFTDSLSFDKIKAQGYNKTSATYRLAEMKVLTGEHNIQTAIHSLNHDIIVFYMHCGKSITINDSEDFLKFIPSNIPEVQALKFIDFPKEKYSEIEKAQWTHTINSLTRKADKFFSLGVNGGYTMNNSTTESDTIDAGLSTTIGGVGLNAGVSVPLGRDDFTPAFTLSCSVSPNSFIKRSITEKTYSLTDRQEVFDIKTAEQNYNTAVVDYRQSLINLKWEKDSVKDSFDLYQKNEEDLLKYYKMGIVTQSEYYSAMNNRQLYEVKMIINKIKFIVYNNDVKSQFVDLETADSMQE